MAVSELTSSRSSLLADIVADLTGSRPSVLTNGEAALWAAAANAMGGDVSHLTHSIGEIILAMDAALGGTKSRLTDPNDAILADVVTQGGGSADRLTVRQETMLARLSNLDLSQNPAADYDLDFTTGSLPSGVTFTRASKGWYFDSSGVLQEAATDAPRFDYHPVTGAIRGLLMEGARTNGVKNPRGENGFTADATTIITNGDFASNPINASQNTLQNGWRWSRAGGTATPTYGSGQVTLSPDGTNNLRIDSSFTVKTLTTYAYSVTIGTNSVSISIGTTQGGTNRVNLTLQGPGTITGTFTTTTETTEWIRISRTTSGAATVDDVIVTLQNRLPDNWSIVNNNGATASLTYAGSGTEDGMPYVDMRYQGTSVSGTALNLFFTGFQEISASQDQKFTGSFYVRLVSGSLSALNNFYVSLQERTTTGANNNSSTTSGIQIPTTGTLRSQRLGVTWTIVKSDTVYIALSAGCAFNTGSTFDFTLRFACAQCELGDAVSSPILAAAGSPVATTRAGEVATKVISPVTLCALAFDGEVRAVNVANTRYLTTLISDDSNDFTELYIPGNSARVFADAESNVSGNFDYVEMDVGDVAAETRFKVAVTQRQSTIAVSLNGGTVQSAAQPVAQGQPNLSIGGATSSGAQMRGWVRRVRVWSRALFDLQLRSVST